MHQRIALICTVLNEAETIPEFLRAIDSMKYRPDEIVIVDGGSRDGTATVIREAAAGRNDLKLLVESGCTIARGRNLAIQHCSADIIAITDAGARVDPLWLEQIVAPFSEIPPADVVAGWYEMDPRSPFEQWVSRLQVPVTAIDPARFLPSARSLALRRMCWERTGGFPEDLTNWAEDTVFARELQSSGCIMKFAPGAIVRWRPRSDVRAFTRQFFNYGRGDGEARMEILLNLKRAVFLAGCAALMIGIFTSFRLALIGGAVAGAGIIRLLLPLRYPENGILHLTSLIPLLVLREGAQVAGYLFGLFTGRRRNT